MLPDDYSLSASVSFVGQFTGSGTHDRYGHTYTAGGAGLGTPGLSGALVAGYLRHPDDPCTPATEDERHAFLEGSSYGAFDGLGIGVGLTRSGGRTAFEIGLATPQSGVSAQVGAMHGEE